MRISLAVGDLTTWTVDAIVNAANSQLKGGGGVDGAIHRAGGPDILAECRVLRQTSEYRDGLPAGQAVATTAGRLAARWVIHTVGPTWAKTIDKSAILRDCYTNSLAVADGLGVATVAFPLISAGVYRWPKDDAVAQALTALRQARTAVAEATLVLFDEATHRLAQQVAARASAG